MRKTLLIIALVVLLLVPIVAFAVTSNTPATVPQRVSRGYAAQQPDLTDQQEADLLASYQQMLALRKETVTKMVQDGLLTEEQGNAELQRLDELAAYAQENGVPARYCMQYSRFADDDDSFGYGGRGMVRGPRG